MGNTHFSAYTEKIESKAQGVSILCMCFSCEKRGVGKVLIYFLISVKLNTSPDKQQTEAIVFLLE